MSEELKNNALGRIVELIKEHELSRGEIEQCLRRAGGRKQDKRQLSPLLQYLGGIFLFSALGVFVGMYWTSLGDTSRILLTLGAGLVCYSLGWLYRSPRVSSILFLMAAPLEPTGMLIFLDTYFVLSDGLSVLLTAITFFVIALQFYIAFDQRDLPVLLNGVLVFVFVGSGFLFEWLLTHSGLGGEREAYFFILGLIFLAVVHQLRDIFHASVVSELWHGFSGLVMVCSLHGLVVQSEWELMYPLAALGLTWFSVSGGSLLLSIVSVATILFYIGELTSRLFEGRFMWPFTLLCVGIACFWLPHVWAKRRAGSDTSE